MDGKQLKNSILQWAIQGKLVPQNPKDEPAQKLLERIAASRNGDVSPWSEAIGSSKNSKKSLSTSLRGAKATKQSKNPTSRIYRENGVWYEQVGTATPKDISDEIPFEIPENWAWCRVSQIMDVKGGKRIPLGSSWTKTKTDHIYIRVTDMKNGTIVDRDLRYISNDIYEKIKNYTISKNDLYITVAGTIGAVGSVPEKFDGMNLTENANKLTDIGAEKEYIVKCFSSPFVQNQFKTLTNQMAQPKLSIRNVLTTIFPLPPLAEQKRIVAKLEQVLPLAEEYGAAQEQLDKLNKELPEALKKSILQEAIQGKLVPQNPKDEPAQKLLERFASSRHSEQSEESSKRSKKTSKDQSSRIYRENGVWYEQIGIASPKDITDEIPFEIPETWAWCRLKNIVFNHGQKIPTESFSYIDIGSIDNKRQKLNDKENIIQASAAPSRARKIVKIDDILYSTVRPYLHNMCIIDREFSKEPIASTGFAVLACNECVVVKFLFYYLLSPKFDDYANDGDNAKGIAYPAINDEKLYKALIPIPPLAEQKRIVAKLEQLLKVL